MERTFVMVKPDGVQRVSLVRLSADWREKGSRLLQ